METQTTLLISPHGLDATEQDALSQVLNMLATDGMQFRLQPDNVQQAHLVILDDETEPGKNALLRARTGQVKLVFSTQSRTGRNLISIRKPINMTSLKTLLVRVCQKMHNQLQQPISTDRTGTLESSLDESAPPNQNLFNTLLTAKNEQQLLKIELPGFPKLYINGQSKSFASTLEQHELKRLFIADMTQARVMHINEQTFNNQTGDMQIAALYRLLWIAGIYGSQGKLISGHSPTQPVKLRAWPNFTRNDFLPQHLKLAAILARQPTPIDKLVETSGIGRSDIVNFYNAAYAVDLIEFAENANTESTASTVRPNTRRHGILSRLAARLKLGT